MLRMPKGLEVACYARPVTFATYSSATCMCPGRGLPNHANADKWQAPSLQPPGRHDSLYLLAAIGRGAHPLHLRRHSEDLSVFTSASCESFVAAHPSAHHRVPAVRLHTSPLVPISYIVAKTQGGKFCKLCFIYRNTCERCVAKTFETARSHTDRCGTSAQV